MLAFICREIQQRGVGNLKANFRHPASPATPASTQYGLPSATQSGRKLLRSALPFSAHLRGFGAESARSFHLSSAHFSTAAEPKLPAADVRRSSRPVRNVAVIAHVDHGKTSLVDALLRQSRDAEGADAATDKLESMDSNPLEKERGITILSKCTSLVHGGMTYNLVDTPGHADFSGEVSNISGVLSRFYNVYSMY
jgi:hypothetical protein